MAGKTFVYNNVAGLFKMLGGLSKEAADQLRTEAQGIAADIASAAASEATSQGGVAALAAPAISAPRDRIPTVRMGSSKKLPESGAGWERSRKGKRQTIGDIVFGAEFGGSRGTRSSRHTSQFLPWRGNGDAAGYFLWPTVREMSSDMQERYGDALLKAIDRTAMKKASRGRVK